MLQELRVGNYAVIDRLELELPGGLVAFTGETGAGKSIIIGALALALGGRSQPDQLRSGTDGIRVEARFSGPFPGSVRALLREAGIEEAGELLLRRTVPAEGRSRAWVNDSLVSLATLEAIGRDLVDIHGQHQHQSLLHPETHLDFLDGFGKLLDGRRDFAALFASWTELRQERRRLAAREKEKSRELDFLIFQKEEIEKASLRPGEEEELEARREILRNSGRLAEGAAEAEGLLYSGDHPAAASVARAAQRLRELSAVDPELEDVARVLEESQVQIEEAGREIQSYSGRLESDPEELAGIEDRLAEIRRLKRKYGDTLEEVLRRLDSLRAGIAGHEEGEARLAVLEAELPGVERDVVRAAKELSRRREKHRGELEGKIVAELRHLSLDGSVFRIELEREEDPGGIEVDGRRFRVDERGLDRARFMISTNPGEEPKPLARIASGGELSRVMLAIKTVLAAVDRVPTLIFDEVDIGIGGRVARLVGDRLRALSAKRQVLCVTHLPQIASLADSHYNISKRTSGKRVRVDVGILRERERIEEIARMLGGKTVTAVTKRHAAEMLGRNG